MDGYKIIAISGIDGNFSDFIKLVEPKLKCKNCLKISYDRSLTFSQNIEIMRAIIRKENEKCCLIGWSIGAVAAVFLSDCLNVEILVMINPFYRRSEVLTRRNIFCDEEVCISSLTKRPIQYVIVSGVNDDKIPYTESFKISKHFKLSTNNLFLIDSAKHSLDSFPLGIISEIVNNYLL
jgi:hypothetical protein